MLFKKQDFSTYKTIDSLEFSLINFVVWQGLNFCIFNQIHLKGISMMSLVVFHLSVSYLFDTDRTHVFFRYGGLT